MVTSCLYIYDLIYLCENSCIDMYRWAFPVKSAIILNFSQIIRLGTGWSIFTNILELSFIVSYYKDKPVLHVFTEFNSWPFYYLLSKKKIISYRDCCSIFVSYIFLMMFLRYSRSISSIWQRSVVYDIPVVCVGEVVYINYSLSI